MFCRAFGPCGVELLAHVAQRLFPSDALVLQTIEVNSTVAEAVDAGAVRAEAEHRADADSVYTKVYFFCGAAADFMAVLTRDHY